MEKNSATLPGPGRNTLLLAVIAGVFYLVLEIILSAMDMAWLTTDKDWGLWTNMAYISLSVMMVGAYIFFMRGFIVLSEIFENSLLKIACYLLIVALAGLSAMDVSFLSAKDLEVLWIPYATAAIVLGTLSIVFGVALLRLQDGMGELSRVAGLLEITMGTMLVTVVFFFISYVILIPAVILEIMVLYRGYEYLSKSDRPSASVSL